jgi:hypothetical protein
MIIYNGGGYTINLYGAGNVVGIYNTYGNWDWINGSNSAVYVNSAQTVVNGGGGPTPEK